MEKTRKYGILLSVTVLMHTAAVCAEPQEQIRDSDSPRYTIEACYEMARENYPLVKQYDLIGITEYYTLKNAYSHYFPQISISGKVTYQTDVPEYPFTLEGQDLPVFSKDQYQAMIELSQIIWDGGQISAQRKNISAKADVERAEYEVNMYSLKDRVNNLFFGILLIREQISQVELLLETLRNNQDKIRSCVDNGVANQTDLDIIEVELISSRQQKVKLETLTDAYLKMLSLMLGTKISSSEELVKPVPDALYDAPKMLSLFNSQILRPELALFDAREKEIATQWDYWTASGMPKVKLFIKGAYGKPAMNYFRDDFGPYAYGGVTFQWDITELYYLGRGKHVIASSKSQVENGRQTFLFNTNLQSEQQMAEIQRYMKIMEDDDAVIELREKVRKATEVGVINGAKSTSDLITEVNKEQIARQDKIVHEMELIKAIYELKNIKNN